MMDEYIRSVFLLNESESFLIVKPLYCSIGHDIILLSSNFQRRLLEDAILINGVFLQNAPGSPEW
jgi:hypothetical protein